MTENSLNDIAKQIKSAVYKIEARPEKESEVKVQLIYAFNGTGKTRLSREFKELISPKSYGEDESIRENKILYYNAFTEDLFYWDNDLDLDRELKLRIHPNVFTTWVLEEQGQEYNVVRNFQHYTSDKLTPVFNESFSEVYFSFARGDDSSDENIKISKGEEACFIWSIFYSLIEQVISVLNVAEISERETNQFDQLEYIFIDDPVSSLDDNHLIELAVDIAQLIKSSKSEVKFIITTHNPLFYNVLYNEFKKPKFLKYLLKKHEDGKYELSIQNNDSPFSYHHFLKSELEKAVETDQLHKYHFNFIRNILEKASTFFGYDNWKDLLSKLVDGDVEPYEKRITRNIDISSHSKQAGEEVKDLTDNDKRVLRYLVGKIKSGSYQFKN